MSNAESMCRRLRRRRIPSVLANLHGWRTDLCGPTDDLPGGVPDTIVVCGHGELENSAVRELTLGWRGMLGREPRVVASGDDAKQAVVIGTQAEIKAWRPQAKGRAPLAQEAYPAASRGQCAGGGGW